MEALNVLIIKKFYPTIKLFEIKVSLMSCILSTL